jgi:hypothetical protein
MRVRQTERHRVVDRHVGEGDVYADVRQWDLFHFAAPELGHVDPCLIRVFAASGAHLLQQVQADDAARWADPPKSPQPAAQRPPPTPWKSESSPDTTHKLPLWSRFSRRIGCCAAALSE